jgi:class 3 adenylate cyclase/tetratricopeptide (TPR) repeat protein
LFADISGFTAMSRQLDPEELKDAMNACFRTIERVVVEHGGTIDKFIGDCVMALFGAPIALEHAPQHAINAAIAIRAAVDAFEGNRRLPVSLRVHIGVNTGLVAAGAVGGDGKSDYTVMGAAVNLASRLQSAAKDGQIFVGETTYKAVSREFQFRPMTLTIKGYDEPMPAFEVLSTEEQRYRARPSGAVGGGRSPMVGRSDELRALAASLEALRDGKGSVACVIGENGMGKSRLLTEALALPVIGDLEVIEGRCLAVGTGLAFHPFVDFLRTWSGASESDDSRMVYDAFVKRADGLPLSARDELLGVAARLLGVQQAGASEPFAGVEGEALERIIRLAIADLLSALAVSKPLLFVVEDVHWADRASLRLLEALLPLTKSVRLVFLVLGRPYYADTTEHLLARLAKEFRDAHLLIRLTPLTAASTSELVANLTGGHGLPSGLQALIAERTEGNPFYVEEVVRGLSQEGGPAATSETDLELPATIEGIILARVDRVDPSTRRVLQIAAVVGRRFDRDIVADLVGDGVDVDAALESLVEKELLSTLRTRWTASQRVVRFAPGREYTFKHALIQEAVYGSLLRKTRRSMHADCARVIESRFADHLHDAYGMLAYHYLRADVLERAEEYTFKAGELAARTAASHEALRYFRETYRIYQIIYGKKGDKTKRALLEKNIAQALFNTGNLRESIEHYDASLSLYGEWLPKSTVTLWLKFGVDISGLLLWLFAGKHRAGSRDRLRDLAVGEMLYQRALAENPTDPTRYVFDTIAACRYVQKLDSRKFVYACETTATTGAFFSFGGLSNEIARRFLDEASHLVREERSVDEFWFRAMGTLVTCLAGDWSGRYDIDDELMDRGLRAGRLWAADTYLGMVAERCYRQGRFDAAEAHIARLRTLQSDYGYDFAVSTATAHEAFALLERGRLEEARAAMQKYYDIRTEDALHVLALSGMAKVEVGARRLDAAEEHLARADAIIARAQRLAPYYMGAYRTARLLTEVSRLEESAGGKRAGRVATASKLAIAISKRIARERPEVLRLSGRAAALAGARDRALDFYGRALDEAQALGAIPEIGRAGAAIATELDRAGASVRFRDVDAAAWRARAVEAYVGAGLAEDAIALGWTPKAEHGSASPSAKGWPSMAGQNGK